MEYEIIPTHRDNIRPGDVILLETGLLHTLCKKDIQYNQFMGICILGDSYYLGQKLVPKAVIKGGF